MKIAVQDANILIDMIEGGFLDLWFALDIETHTTDQVLAELKVEEQRSQVDALIPSGKLNVSTCDSELMFELAAMKIEKDDLSIQDCSILHLSEELGAMLLTGDRDLREHAADRHVEVHGTLWILDQLVDSELLTPDSAAEKLSSLLGSGRRLPSHECDLRLRQWRTTRN